MFAFTLLGGFELRLEGRDLRALPRKARALLAYLSMQEGKPVPREAVADLLWTDRGAEQARHSLRQTLLVLRRELGPDAHDVIRLDERMLSLAPETVQVDALQFRRLSATTDRVSLEAAAALYRGPPMEGLPAISRDFDAWLETTREAFAQHAAATFGRLADACAKAEDWDAAIHNLERMLALDPLREDVHRRLIEMCGRAGRRSEALRQYKACVDLLRRELNVAPAPETEALVRRIREEERNGSVADPPTSRSVFAAPNDGPPWIAVLPFRATGRDPVPDYFATGLVEDMVCALATLREPIVISSHSTLMFRNALVDLRQVGRELGVRYAVSGSVRRLGDRLRLSAELADTTSSAVLWANSYDFQIDHLFDTQDSIVSRIVGTLVPRVQEAELHRIRAKRPETMTAYDLVLQARERIYQLDRAAFDQAQPLLQRAVGLDPHYAAAQALFAEWYTLRLGQGWSETPAQDVRRAERLAKSAMADDPFDARALSLNGHSRAYLHRDYDGALTLFGRALDGAPNDAASWMWSSVTHSYLGRGTEAITRAQKALRLSPRDPFSFRLYSTLCIAHYTNAEYEAAADWGIKAAESCPAYTSNLRYTIAALGEVGRTGEARELAQQMLRVQPSFSTGSLLQTHPYRDRDRRARIAERLIEAGLPA
ncbi:MAG: tetratricopeptide repeat protein [Rhodospirillales bacterium]|nr:tetratricopeptide repeat protein [Rhodospirillales bacterium]